MIYTIEYLKGEAYGIIGSWDGKTNEFYYQGDKYHEEDVNTANELLQKIKEVELLANDLNL